MKAFAGEVREVVVAQSSERVERVLVVQVEFTAKPIRTRPRSHSLSRPETRSLIEGDPSGDQGGSSWRRGGGLEWGLSDVGRSDLVTLVRSIRLETVISAPREACFDLSLSVDAHTGSMAASGEHAVAGVTRGVMKFGDTVTWQARHFGITFRMTSAITEYERPIRFVDEQQRGPFQRWWHEHTFTAVSGGTKTLMVDVVEFGSGFGAPGGIADRLLLKRYMCHLLRRRNAWLKGTLKAAH